MRFYICVIVTFLFLTHNATAQLPTNRIHAAVTSAIESNELPGAVVLVQQQDRVLIHRAFGQRAVEPQKEAMTADTVFDLASLTKPVATATSIYILLEQGKLRLDDPVAKHWPEFAAHGKDKITLEMCLLHTTGLTADNALKDYDDGPAKAFERVAALKLEAEPGTRFRYSDVGFIVLGRIVEKLSGMPLYEFAAQTIFQPLGMKDTGFRRIGQKHSASAERCAPTTKLGDQWLRGIVHDPRAYRLGGVAGHAGLFSTADDLACYCRMILNGGELNGKRILKPETVRLFTEGVQIPKAVRSRGWDVDSSFSANRGTLFPKGKSFGHTGFTGTSLWLDPGSNSFVIFLSNRVHPNEKGNVTKLRGIIATHAAELIRLKPVEALATGIDVLVAEKFARLKGKRVGLVTNHTGRDREGRATIDLLHAAEGVKLVALFSPEHGIRGAVDQKVGDSRDEKTGLPIYSLYGQRTKPDAKSLEGLDVLVYDIQDIGCRFYTYTSTLGHVMEAAAEHKKKLLVLDRPNPIGGVLVEGPVRDDGRESFVGWHSLPIRHGMTIGELAMMFKAERKIDVDLEVVQMTGWRRDMLYDQTGLEWVNPSPNMRSLTAALLYPGVGLLETTNISVGRGTERPFEWIGAPWLDGKKLAAALRNRDVPGVRFVPRSDTPASSVHAKKLCGGVVIFVDDWSKLQPVRLGLAIALELKRTHANDWQSDRFDRLLIHKATFDAVVAGKELPEIESSWVAGLNRFAVERQRRLLYE
jgi:uncharacterized protein YbbC (DUF1343 family)/CubicO group peptidase (beta-lactamase class C family)